MSDIGVLVMAYGGPDDLDQVEAYLLDVRGYRPTAPEITREVRERYREIGGRSPILERTQAQAQALEAALNANGARFKTFVGMRHWHPYIKDSLAAMAESGLTRAAGRVRAALERFPAEARAGVPIIFTAHSLPRRILEWSDPYPDELQATTAAVMERLGPHPHQFAFQSAAMTPEPWLGPEAGEAIAALARDGHRNILLAPVGFVCEHVEILYDVDVVFQRQAQALGVRLERIEMLNTAPAMIAGLAGLVRETAGQAGWM